MLSLAKFPTQVQYSVLLHNPVSQNLHSSSKTQFPISSRLSFHAVLGNLENGLCCKALKTKKKGNFTLSETDGPDEFEDEFDDEFLDVDDDGELDQDDEGEDFVPLKNMKHWLQNRPRGFGEGKVYDTSIEDKLLEEIEQSRKAQIANLNKLKNNPVQPSSQKETKKQNKGLVPIEDGFRVRLVNLPKKKNIHRDLQLAFKEVRGILNIIPLVSGNEKTRDPVCKGLAFVDFKYQDEAQRFVQNFSGESISFGKVQKQIKCEMMNPKSQKPKPMPTQNQSVKESNSTPQQTVLNLDEDSDSEPESDGSESDSWEESEEEADDGLDERKDDGEMKQTSTASGSNLAEEHEVGKESATSSSSSSSDQGRKGKMNKKKAVPKARKDKKLKLKIPGSAKRLKIREKAALTDAFTKYGANANSNSTVIEQS